MATGLLESMDYKGGGLLERTHCTSALATHPSYPKEQLTKFPVAMD